MAANQFIPITDLPPLPGAPGFGHALVIQAVGVTYQVDARQFPLINDMLITWSDQRASLPGSRFLSAGTGITLGNNGDEIIINATGSGSVVSVVAGSGIAVDATDPANPIVAASMPAQNILYNGLIDTAIFPDARAVTNGAGIEFTATPGIFDIRIADVIMAGSFMTSTDMTATFVNSAMYVAGANITITPLGGGQIEIAASGGGGGGTVTSVGSGAGLTGGPITTTGSLAIDYTANATWTGAHTFTIAGSVDFAGLFKASGAEGAEGQVLSSNGPGVPAVWRSAAGGSIDLGFNFNTSTANADPGNQKLAFNFAGFNATALYVDEIAFTNFDANTILSLLQAGNRIYIQQRNLASKAVVFQVTGVGTHHTGYWEIPVVMVDSRGTLFAANADLTCVFILSVSSSPIGGSDTQVQFNDGGNFGGNAIFTFDKTLGVVSVGTLDFISNATAPSDVGIRNASGVMTAYTNGSARITVAAAGNVVVNAVASGITMLVGAGQSGSISLSVAALTAGIVQRWNDGTVNVDLTTAATKGNIGTTTAHAFDIYTNSTARISLASAGNVVINAPSSGVALTVSGVAGSNTANFLQTSGDAIVLAQTTTSGNARFQLTTVGVVQWDIRNVRASGALDFQVAGTTTTMSISAAGNVVIAAPSSADALTISGLTGANAVRMNSTGAASYLGLGWAIGLTAGAWNLFAQSTDPLVLGTTGAASATVYTNAAVRMVVSSAGNVTINSPASGITLALTTVAGANAIGLSLDVASATSENLIRIALNGVAKSYFGLIGTANDLINGSAQNDTALRLETANFLVSGDAGTSIGLKVSSANVVSVNDAGTLREVGYRNLVYGSDFNTSANENGSTSNGKIRRYTGGSGDTLTVQDGTAEHVVTIINNGSGSLTIADGLTGVLRWFSGAAPTNGNRTLASGGLITLSWLDSQNVYCWGTGIT